MADYAMTVCFDVRRRIIDSVMGLRFHELSAHLRTLEKLTITKVTLATTGIGFLINQSIQLFRFDEMLTHILVVLVLIVAVDQLSAQVRRRLGSDT